MHDKAPGIPVAAWPTSSLLGRLAPTDRDDLLSIGTRAVFPAQHVLIRQGADEDHVVLLTKGLTKIVVDTPGGHEALLAVRVGGDLVGEMASLENKPRSATVIVCVKTSAHIISAALFRAFLATHSRAHYEVTRMLSSRFRCANEERVAFTSLPAPARIARVIVKLAQAYGRDAGGSRWELGVALSRAELASFAGVGLSSAEKSLRRLEESGVISRRYRGVFITNMAALRPLAALSDPNP